MSEQCPKCGSLNVADVVYGHFEPGARVPKDSVAGGCCVNPTIQWHCRDCHFEWAPKSILQNTVKNMENEFWRGAECCLSLKIAEQGDEEIFSDIQKKIGARKKLSSLEIDAIIFDTNNYPLDERMQSNIFVKEQYENMVMALQAGETLDVDKETLDRWYGKEVAMVRKWEEMSKHDRSAFQIFSGYERSAYINRLLSDIELLKYKISLIENRS